MFECCQREEWHPGTGCARIQALDATTTPALSSPDLWHTWFLKPSKNFPGWGDPKLTFCLLCLLQEGKEEDAEPALGHTHPSKPTETRERRKLFKNS